MTRYIEPGIEIVYEDNHLLVVVKPPNMPVQADDSKDLDLLNALKHDLKIRYAKPGLVYVGLVHRLDRPVGGVMVFAKTSKAASRLSATIRNHHFSKNYWCIIHGVPRKYHNRLVHYLIKDEHSNTVSAVGKEHPAAKEAVLEYNVIGTENGLSLVNVQLLTGRAHQIRVQFASIGFPLYGDQRYGAMANRAGQQIALWSTKLSFEHPTLRNVETYSALPPLSNYPWNLWKRENYSATLPSK